MKFGKVFFVLGAVSVLATIPCAAFIRNIDLRWSFVFCFSVFSSSCFWAVGMFQNEGRPVGKENLNALNGRVWRANLEGEGKYIQLVDITNPRRIVFAEREAVPAVEGEGYSDKKKCLITVKNGILRFLPE